MIQPPVSDFTLGRIRSELDELETGEGLRMLFAVDAGPRAWRTHSPDSRYVIRFVYIRPPEWHYRLGPRADTCERAPEGRRDVVGWELKRALTQLLASNVVVAEWLRSSVVYSEQPEATRALSILAEQALDRTTVTEHYLAILKRETGRLAKAAGPVDLCDYLSTLRSALALRWVRMNGAAMPPVDVTLLADGSDLSAEAEESLAFLLAQKMTSEEYGLVTDPLPALDALLAEELDLAERWIRQTRPTPRADLIDAASELHMAFSMA